MFGKRVCAALALVSIMRLLTPLDFNPSPDPAPPPTQAHRLRHAGVALSSPLTRAVQTAILALANHK